MAVDVSLQCYGYSVNGVVVTLDVESSFSAAGDSVTPLLGVTFRVKQRVENGLADLSTHDMMFWSAWLASPSTTHHLWSQTGFQPINEQLFLPLTHQQIEILTRQAASNPEERVHLWLRVAVVVHSHAIADQRGQLPPSVTLASPNWMFTVDKLRWHSYLKQWGYPETRLIQVVAELPVSLAADNPTASEFWKAAVQTVSDADNHLRNGNWRAAGLELRQATEFALFTWCALWGNDQLGKDKNVSAAHTFLDQVIPQLEPVRGKWAKAGDPKELHIVCTRYHMLRQLYRFAHAPHHGQIYTPEDVEYLLTSLAALFRAFPAFWAEHTEPLRAPKAATDPT